MSAPAPSNLDFEQCIRGAYEDDTGRLRVDAQISAPLDMNGELLVDIRAEDGDSVLLVGTLDATSTGTVQYVKVNPDGSLNVNTTGSITGTVNQGDPNAFLSNGWPVKITDGVDLLAVNTDGSINVNNVTSVVSNTATLSNVTSSTLTQSVLPSNPLRKGFILLNDSTELCYIAFAATASTSAFSILLNQKMAYQNESIIYTGVVSAIWPIANGFLRVTELT